MFSLFKISLLKRSWFLSAPYLLKQTLHSKGIYARKVDQNEKTKNFKKNNFEQNFKRSKAHNFYCVKILFSN